MSKHSRATQRRLPTGRAWNGPVMKAIFDGIADEFDISENAISDVADIDNILFNDKLSAWQNVLGLNPDGTTEEQENDVVRKLSDIGGLRAEDMELQLQNAGFNVYVHVNHFSISGIDDQYNMGNEDSYMGNAAMATPLTVAFDPRPIMSNFVDYSMGNDDTYMGSASMQASRQFDLLVNNIDATEDEQYRATIQSSTRQDEWQYILFLGGSSFLDIASVDSSRESEFRRLLLELKPLGMMAILMVNYT